MELRRIQKINKSLSVAIPGKYVDQLGISKGDYVMLTLEGNTVVIQKPEIKASRRKDEKEA